MIEPRCGLRLAPEPREGILGEAPHSLQDLERDLPVEPRVLGEVDDALAAAADLVGGCGSGQCDRLRRPRSQCQPEPRCHGSQCGAPSRWRRLPRGSGIPSRSLLA